MYSGMRCFGLVVSLALLAFCAMAPAGAANPAGVLVAEPVADPQVEAVARGASLWLTRQINAAGLGAQRAPHGSTPDIESAQQIARETGAAYVLVPRLRVRDGMAEARWLLFPAGKPKLIAAPSGEASLGNVGDACLPALRGLLTTLGADLSRTSSSPPSLDELASSGRALAHLDAGRLLRAWREVEGKLSPTAMGLRESLVELARRKGPAAAERARVLAAAGDDRGAWGLIAAEIAGSSPSRAALLAAAEVRISRGDPRGALHYLDRLLSASPEDAEGNLDLGLAHAASGHHAEARRALKRAAQLDPHDPRPLLALEPLEENPAAKARVLLAAGALKAAQLSPRRAKKLLERAASLDPALAAPSWSERAELAQATGRSAEALKAWHRAAAGGGDTPEIWLGIGHARRALGEPEALAAFERAAELAPNHPGALTAMGRLQIQFGRAALAVPLLERAVAAEPTAMAGRVALARALQATERADEARAVLRAAPVESIGSLRSLAALERKLGDLVAARADLTRAMALDPWDPELLADAAELELISGNADAAKQAQDAAALLGSQLQETSDSPEIPTTLNLHDLILAFSNQVPRSEQRAVAQLGLREALEPSALWQQWLLPRTPNMEILRTALDHALGLRFARIDVSLPGAPDFERMIDGLFDFDAPQSLDAQTIAEINSRLGVDAVFLTRIVRTPESAPAAAACFDTPGTYALESRMLLGSHADVASILVALECLPGALTSYGTWNVRAAGAFGLLSLFLLFPMLRGWGTLKVEIRLPPRTKGVLAIKVGRKPLDTADEKRRQMKRESAWRRFRRTINRYERSIVGRETIFRWIPRRSYFVTVRGKLFDAMGDEEIGFFLEEQQVKIERRRVAQLKYDFNPSEVAVLVSVMNGEQRAAGARVALRADPNSLRYVRDKHVYFYLGEGEHVLCAGAGGRATERVISIKSLENAMRVSFDLADEASLMVNDCEAAVEPYLIGDFRGAARALTASGDDQRAHMMLGAHYQQCGDLEQAATELEAAGCIEEAAELRSSSSDHGGSADLFEQAGDYARAADAHRAAGEHADAARCYEAVYDWESAIECWNAAGDLDHVIDLHEKQGSYLEAAELAVELGQVDRALEDLQEVERRDGRFGEACRLTAHVLSLRGEFDAAAQRQREAIEIAGGDNAPADLHERYAELLAACDDKEAALAAYETVRRIDPRRSDVTQHIERLREELTHISGNTPGPSRGAGTAAVPSRYELLEEIGRGGMGVVYKARDTRLGRIVALKRLPDNLRDNETAARLFLREARAAASLNHVNIVTLYDADEENGVYHITMELLEGLPINVIQERRKQIGIRDVARIGIQACTGLQYAHDRRIVHRDIKTANLFFTREKVVKIMDFGLAKTIEEVRKHSTVIGGTPYYMAPEQAAGGEIGPATDLYALGVTLHRLLTGTFPFTEGDLAYHHRHTPAPDPRQHRSDLPEAAARLILDLLEKDPDRRPSCAAEVARRLEVLRQS